MGVFANEYKVLDVEGMTADMVESRLNKMANDGWDLVQTIGKFLVMFRSRYVDRSAGMGNFD